MILNNSFFVTNKEIDKQFSEYSNQLAIWFSYYSEEENIHDLETPVKFIYFVWLKSSHGYPRIMCNNLLCKYFFLYIFLYIFLNTKKNNQGIYQCLNNIKLDYYKIEQYIVKNISQKEYHTNFFLVRKIKSINDYTCFEKEFVKKIK